MRNLDQERAKHAWDAVQKIKGHGKEEAANYGREAKKLPIRIMTAGLGHALAFINAKKKKGGLKELLDNLTEWVLEKRELPCEKRGDLLQSIIKGDSNFLRWTTDEILSYLQWLNRFAEAEGLTDLETD